MSDLEKNLINMKDKYEKIFQEQAEYISSRVDELDINSILEDMETKQREIFEKRNKYSCVGCGACCKLAISEFSYEELKSKAKNGDNFATQFISIFVPYKDISEAKKIFPEYIELLEAQKENENVYFYHCPKVTQNNRCPDYENRPQICRDFPDNPIAFLPKTCGFSVWKQDVEEDYMKNYASVEIIDYLFNE